MGLNLKKSMLWLAAASPMMLAAPIAQAASIDGSWSGSGFVKPKSGAKENVRCRVSYSKQTDKVYGVVATCATASNKIRQTGTILKVNDGRYVGDFYNGQFDISGRVRVRVNGSRQIVTFSSGSGTGQMELQRR